MRLFLPKLTLVVLLLGVLVLLFLLRPGEVVRVENNGYSDEFTELLGRTEHIIDSMFNPVLADLESDKPYQEIPPDFVERARVCRSLLVDIKSPILDDPKTRDEFITAWEHLYVDKYNMVCFKMSDRANKEYHQNMNQ